ncbi:Yip1 family protein [Pontibacter sp. JAM-7]|uniref:Yip1 family protein n=1 Tax=Pontibacter sp. JAM-7 TaxID=3366581 RepID=UPI003AF71546
MFLQHIAGFIQHPITEWQLLRRERSVSFEGFLLHVAVLALIPSVCLFLGTTQVGWRVAGSEPIRLSLESAAGAAIAFYLAMLVAVMLVTYAIHWMEKTYGGYATMNDCLNLTTYTALPLFLSGFAGLYPLLWFNVIIGLLALSYSLYLLYKGTAIIMQIPEERAFMFIGSILTVALCVLVGLMIFSVILWDSGLPLNFIR